MRSPPRLPFALLWVFSAFLLPVSLPAAPLRVLFLGNSLTAGNDVPALVDAMAQLQGVDFDYTAVAPGGYAIEDHWNDGRVSLLETGNYDVLILQQGPSTLAESQVNLREWAITWANAARQLGARPALYMIWPVRTQANGFFLVSQSYQNAAFAAGAAVFPAGEVWQQVLRTSPTIPLYSGDDLHATSTGSFLAAMVIARGLFSLDPARVPATVRGITVPTATLTTFRNAVSSLPASTMTGLDTAAPGDGSAAPTPVDPPIVTPPGIQAPPTTTPSTPTPTPSTPATSGSQGGGGGAPSAWFFIALLAAVMARMTAATRCRM